MATVETPKDDARKTLAPSESDARGSLRGEVSSLTRYLRESRNISRMSLAGLAFLGLIGFFYFAKVVFLPLVFALLLSFLFRPLVRALMRVKIPAPVGAAVVLGLALLGVVHGVSKLQEPAAEWLAKAPENLKAAEGKIRNTFRRIEPLRRFIAPPGEVTSPAEEKTPKVELTGSYITGTVLSFTTSVLTGLIETFVLLYFFLATGDHLMRKLVRAVPSFENKRNVIGIVHDVQHNISAFLFTITVINLCLGALVALGAYCVGMSNALFWGVLAAVLNFIPYFGPFTGVVILSIAGLLTFDSVGQGLLPPLIYLTLHAIESNFVTPMVLGRRLTLNPVVIFLSLMFWMWLWGIPGALLAVPFLMTVKILCDHIKPLAPLGELLK
jgi:predicted PurR-regulated permease PerM